MLIQQSELQKKKICVGVVQIKPRASTNIFSETSQ